MPNRSDIEHRARTAAILSLLTALAGAWFLVMPIGESIRNASFDWYYTIPGAAVPPPSPCPVVVVYLDLESYLNRELDPIRPWPRSLYAQLLDRLSRAGARAVAIDILFSHAETNAVDDLALRASIRRNGRVLLAGGIGTQSQGMDPNQAPWSKEARLELPALPFLEAAAGWGLADVRPDRDFVVRHQNSGWPGDNLNRPSLPSAVGRFLGLASTSIKGEAKGMNRWMRYYGPALSLPHVSMDQALSSEALPDDWFRDKVVFVGARPMSGTFPDRRDEYRSPFRSWSEPDSFQPGVEIHATQLVNLIQNDWLRQPPPAVEFGVILAIGVILGFGLVGRRPTEASVICLAVGLLVVLGASVAFRGGNFWVPWLIVPAIQLPCAFTGTMLAHWHGWLKAKRRLESAKRQDEARIREQAALLERAHDIILVRDRFGAVRFANPSATRLLGIAEGNTPSLQAHELFHSEQFHVAEAEVLQQGEWNGELRVVDASGTTRQLETRCTLICDASGQPSSMLVIASDVTARRQLEAEVNRAQRMEAIGALAGGMAHDLNNSLAPVLLGVQLLRRESLNENSRKLVDLMESSVLRGADMVQQVLLFARGHSAPMEELDIQRLVLEMVTLATDTFPRNIHVSSHIPGTLWPIRGNATEFHQVLLNLAVNARDAMPEGGSLCFSVENVEIDASQVSQIPGATPGHYVAIMVSDTGTGIAPDVLPKMFEPFFTTKPEGRGTGLGLSTSQRVVRKYGGFLHVVSVVGEGTTIEVFLPRTQVVEMNPLSKARTNSVRGHGESIWIIEDDIAVLEMIRRGLLEQGYIPRSAANGAEVGSLSTHECPPALILCDASMPLPDGTYVWEALHAAHPSAPLILMGIEGNVPQESNVHRIQKPFSWESLVRLVETCFLTQ